MDPAGLPYINGTSLSQKEMSGPSGAGGSSKTIYEFLGISKMATFEYEVREAITKEKQAKYHRYGTKHCIHVVGLSLREKKTTNFLCFSTSLICLNSILSASSF